MTDTGHIREHMEVVGSCGRHVGTVDHLDGESIKLTRNDPDAGGMHHWVPLTWIDHVGEKVNLKVDCDRAKQEWYDSAPA